MYSMERRKDQFQIIYAWHQLKEMKENIMDLKTSNNRLNRLINN